MKYLLLALPATLLATHAFGQQIEYSGRANASFSNFGGGSAVSTTTINYSNAGSDGSRATNAYGDKLGTGFGASVRAQRVAKVGLLTAFDLGYDWMQTRTSATYINYYSTVANYGRTASGTVHLYTQCLTAFAGAGWRLGGQKLTLDALIGPELAYVLAAQEKGSGTTSASTAWATDVAHTPDNRLDFRLRGDLTLWRSRVGLTASYDYGFTNHQASTNLVADPSAHIRSLRVGLAYRLK